MTDNQLRLLVCLFGGFFAANVAVWAAFGVWLWITGRV